jgi:hypothetical protein
LDLGAHFDEVLCVQRETSMKPFRVGIGAGHLLRERLAESGWNVLNRTKLQVVCFTPSDKKWDMAIHQRAAAAVVESGGAWISSILLGGKKPALRACITNYRTELQHIEMLPAILSKVRHNLSAQKVN